MLIALQDVDSTLGPTLIWPGTHTSAFHALQPHEQACLLDEMPPVEMLLPKGSGVLYDSSIFHAGGANNSDPGYVDSPFPPEHFPS